MDKKKFLKPEMEVIEFYDDDILTNATSGIGDIEYPWDFGGDFDPDNPLDR